MMVSSSGNIFRVTGPLCGEFTGPGEFPAQRPVTRSFDVFFHLHPNKRLSKQSWGWWFETPSRSLWCHRNDVGHFHGYESRMHWHMLMHSSGWTTQAATSTSRLISHIMYIDWLSWYRNFVNNNKGNVHDGWFWKIPASVWCPERKSISKRDALTYD